MDFYTLSALAHDWDALLRGAAVDAAWTQSPRESSLGLGDGAHTVRVICDPALTLAFRAAGAGRQRRNTADVLGGLAGRTVTGVRTAERDRHLVLGLDDGSRLQIVLFGPRPNVLWVGADETVRAAFLDEGDWVGGEAPAPRPAPVVSSAEAFAARWRSDRKTLAQALAGAVPLFTRDLAAEALRRAGLDPDAPPDGVETGPLFEAARAFETALAAPDPHVYWRGPVAEAFALVPLAAPGDWRAERFETVDDAVAVWARRSLAQRAYRAAYAPLDKALAAAARRRARSAEAMLEELAQPSRADRYETWGHLLMAQATSEGPGREAVTLPDIIAGTGAPVEIPLDPARSAVENAERYYDKARRTRGARQAAEARWAEVSGEAEAAADLLAGLRATTSLGELRDWREAHAAALDRILGSRAETGPAEPFRRVPLPGGFEALVGKHARGNAHLTRLAAPHDLWLHARGVPGSHVVVRRPGRSTVVPTATVHAAARLAAHHSTARTQSVVPVTVTERKYVRPIKGGPPGLVRIEREDVLDVIPGEG